MTTKELLETLKRMEGWNNVKLAEVFEVSRQQIASYLKGSEMPFDKVSKGLDKAGYKILLVSKMINDTPGGT